MRHLGKFSIFGLLIFSTAYFVTTVEQLDSDYAKSEHGQRDESGESLPKNENKNGQTASVDRSLTTETLITYGKETKLVATASFPSPTAVSDLPVIMVEAPADADTSSLDALAHSELRVSWSTHSKAPRWVIGRVITQMTEDAIRQRPLESANTFLTDHKRAFGIAQIDSEFGLIKDQVSDGLTHVFLQQSVDGVEVYGGQVTVHFDKTDVVAVNGTLATSVGIDLEPKVTKSAALAAAYTASGATSELNPTRLVILSPDVNPTTYETQLAWVADLVNESTGRTHQVMVDAVNGNVIRSMSLDPTINRNVWDYAGTSGPGTQIVSNDNYLPGSNSHPEVVAGYDLMGQIHSYWLYGPPDRISYDNNDGDLDVAVRRSGQNAGWSRSQKRLVFSSGLAVNDIAGHEFTHGVMDEQGILDYIFQSGALNESYADLFGLMVDPTDFLMGEDSSLGAIRDVSQPWLSNRSQPWHVSQYQCLHSFVDHGGVHINSGIPNYVGYLIISSIGHADAAAIFYRTMQSYLTQNSNFADARDASFFAAITIFGSPFSPQAGAVQQAFTTVGLPPSAAAPSCAPSENSCFLSGSPIEPPSGGGGSGGGGSGGGGPSGPGDGVDCSGMTCTINDPLYFDGGYLAVAATVRDDVLPDTALGQQYLSLYYQHSDQVSALLASDVSLIYDASLLILEGANGFAYALDQQNNAEVRLTREYLDALKAFGEELALLDNGGALSTDLGIEIAETDWIAIEGMTYIQGMDYLNDLYELR